MHISSNEISTQNQLAMSEVIHELMYMFKLFNFINLEHTQFHDSNTSQLSFGGGGHSLKFTCTLLDSVLASFVLYVIFEFYLYFDLEQNLPFWSGRNQMSSVTMARTHKHFPQEGERVEHLS